MRKIIVKTFEFKGQQVNYFNKLIAQGGKFSYVGKYTNADGEYIVEYIYA